MTLWGNLAVGSQALLSFQRGIATVNKNMTNVNTEGYKREIAFFKDENMGAMFDRSERYYSESLQKRYVAVNQEDAYYTNLSNSLSQIENIFNDIEGSGFEESLDNFFLAMNDIITMPNDIAARDSFLYETESLLGRIRTSYNELENIKNTNIDKLKDDVNVLNDKLKALAKINKEIRYEQDALDIDRFNTLKNQQDQLVVEISSLIDTTPRYNDNGTVDILSAKGHALVLEDRAYTLSVKIEPSEVTIQDTDNNTEYKYTRSTPHVLLNGADLTKDFKSGSIAAAIATDDAANEAIELLNRFTYKFANEVNISHTFSGKYTTLSGIGSPDEAVSDSSGTLTIEYDGISKEISYDDTTTLNDIANLINSDTDLSNILEATVEFDSASGKYNLYLEAKNKSVGSRIEVTDSGDFIKNLGGGSNKSYDLNSEEGGVLFKSDNDQKVVDASNISLAFKEPELIAAAIDPTATSADNRNFKELLDIKDETWEALRNQSFKEYYSSSIVAHLGSKTNYTQNLEDEKKALLEGINQKIDELSGVNIDEELINLQQLQRSYQASARIITVTDELLQTVLGLIR